MTSLCINNIGYGKLAFEESMKYPLGNALVLETATIHQNYIFMSRTKVQTMEIVQ